ncbi:hypothetical protein ACWC5I_43160 [Kitasatospora sp. NPDC001574]
MELAEVLEALRERWDEVQEFLDEPARARLRELLTAPSGDPERIARRIVRLLLASVPDGHPVRAVFEDSVRYARGARAEQINREAVLSALAFFGRRPAAAQPPPDADDWLLDAENVTAAEYRAGGHDPADPDLIRLTDRQGTVRLPSFQFDGASGLPLPLVVEVNRLLDADDDPWGVADWWLGANAWLDAVPARLLGTPGEHSLLAAARAEIAEW